MDELPQNQLVTEIKELTRFAEELKNRQITAGDSLRFHLVDNDQVLWSGFIDEPSSGGPGVYVKNITINYIAGNQDNVFADIIPDLYVGNLSTRYDPLEHYYEPLLNAGSYIDLAIYYPPGDVDNERLSQFFITLLSNDNTIEVFLKAKIVATDTPA